MTAELVALLSGRAIGRIQRDSRGRLAFAYEEDWRTAAEAYPLSLSMPLAATTHAHGAVDAFLWGLLPDNAFVLDRWAKRFQVSPRHAFGLIANVGEDCAGAVQFVAPERLDSVLATDRGVIDWLDERSVAERLRLLRADHSAWRAAGDTGQFSLAGAQPKTALLLEDGRWGIPSGRIPTTHILKPPTGDLDGHAENEHFCLELARACDMPTASSEVVRFADEVAIVVARYDRRRTARGLIRIHQEDMCQALGVPPTRKYENEKGPGVRQVVEVLQAHSGAAQEDIAAFVDALAFNWLIAGTDAHAKNFSILIGPGGRVRLAPLYDLASALPYDGFDEQKLKLAMKIGDEYRLRDIGIRQWQRLANVAHLDPDMVQGRVAALTGEIADRAASTAKAVKEAGLAHPLIDRLAERIAARARYCSRMLGRQR